MKYLLMGAVIINSIIGSYNVIFADWSFQKE